MASAAEIQIVKDNLPSRAEAEDGWDDAKIELYIDQFGGTSKTVRQYWSARAAATASFVSVSESGSSRNLSDIHKQALEMLKYWDDKVKEEEAEEENPVVSDGRVAFHKLKRV